MKCKFVYDENGHIITRNYNASEETKVFSKIVDIPEGKDIVGFDLETQEPKWVDVPKTELEEMKGQIGTLCVALANLMGGM